MKASMFATVTSEHGTPTVLLDDVVFESNKSSASGGGLAELDHHEQELGEDRRRRREDVLAAGRLAADRRGHVLRAVRAARAEHGLLPPPATEPGGPRPVEVRHRRRRSPTRRRREGREASAVHGALRPADTVPRPARRARPRRGAHRRGFASARVARGASRATATVWYGFPTDVDATQRRSAGPVTRSRTASVRRRSTRSAARGALAPADHRDRRGRRRSQRGTVAVYSAYGAPKRRRSWGSSNHTMPAWMTAQTAAA